MYKFKGKGFVFDVEKDKAVAFFKDGTFETDNEELAEYLMDRGYDYEEVESDELVDEDEGEGSTDDEDTGGDAE